MTALFLLAAVYFLSSEHLPLEDLRQNNFGGGEEDLSADNEPSKSKTWKRRPPPGDWLAGHSLLLPYRLLSADFTYLRRLAQMKSKYLKRQTLCIPMDDPDAP